MPLGSRELVFFALSIPALLCVEMSVDYVNGMKFSMPQMSEEEKYSKAMPDSEELRCDACCAMAQNVAAALMKAEFARQRPLQETELDAALVHVCRSLTDYGAKEVDGKIRFSGPGLVQAKKGGIMSGGGIWQSRIQGACRTFVGDDPGDEEIYEQFKRVVPGPIPGGIRAEGAEAFQREMCRRNPLEGGGGGRKRRKAKRASKKVPGSCPENLLSFGLDGWKEVLAHQEKVQPNVEL